MRGAIVMKKVDKHIKERKIRMDKFTWQPGDLVFYRTEKETKPPTPDDKTPSNKDVKS